MSRFIVYKMLPVSFLMISKILKTLTYTHIHTHIEVPEGFQNDGECLWVLRTVEFLPFHVGKPLD